MSISFWIFPRWEVWKRCPKTIGFHWKWESDFVPRTYSEFESNFDFDFVCETKSNVMVNNSLKWGHPPSVLGWINSWDVYLQIQLSNVYLWTESGWWHQCMFSTILSHRQILNLNQTQIQNKSWAQNQIPIFQWNPIVFRHLFLTSYPGSIQNEVAMQNNKQNLIMYLPSYCAQNCIKI